MTSVQRSEGNVYADLGGEHAEDMLIKAQLATKISQIIERRGWTQVQAASVLGMTQPKLSGLLRGHFRGISETRMLDCLARLGRDVRIVIGAESKQAEGRVTVVFAE